MTYFKVCSNCGKKSFSASRKSKWICPYCEEDLEGERAEEISNLNSNKSEKDADADQNVDSN